MIIKSLLAGFVAVIVAFVLLIAVLGVILIERRPFTVLVALALPHMIGVLLCLALVFALGFMWMHFRQKAR